MEFQNFFTSRFLVKTIDILCNNGAQLSPFFEPGERDMGIVWLGIFKNHFVSVKSVEFPGVL